MCKYKMDFKHKIPDQHIWGKNLCFMVYMYKCLIDIKLTCLGIFDQVYDVHKIYDRFQVKILSRGCSGWEI